MPWKTHAVVGFFIMIIMAFLLSPYAHTLDIAVSLHYFDTDARVFPLRYDFWLDKVFHNGPKLLIYATFMTIIGCFILAHRQTWPPLDRRQLLWLLIAFIVPSMLIAFGKNHTTPLCPYDMLEFGGRHEARPFHWVISASQSGHCFPAGHPSIGFSFLALAYFYYLKLGRTNAKVLLWSLASLLLGVFLGWIQIARGAHFVSHVLWTACIMIIALHGLVLVWPSATQLTSK
jgi:membrane-associated PAP2 superfamily phosphatase